MTLTVTLDWLTFTFMEDTEHAARWISIRASSKGAVDCAPANGYTAAYKTTQGVYVMWNLDRPEMGTNIDISGTTLRNILEQQNVDQKTLLVEICDAGGKFARLDLAKDLKDEQVSLDKIYQAFERRENRGTARKVREWHDIEGGQTIYIGSPKSDKQARVYNKAAEQGIKDQLWYRFEIQCRRLVARSTAFHLAQSSVWGEIFDSVALHMADLPNSSDWARFWSDNNPKIGVPLLSKVTDREKWITSQVIPAVVKHYIENRKSEAIKLLRQMLDQLDNTAYTHDDGP